MTITLGISCFYHDAAAALVRDGEIIAAAQEERFSRRKGDPSFPESAINYCMEEARIRVDEIDSVVFYDRPGLTFDRIVRSFLSVAPRGFKAWREAVPRWMGEKFHTSEIIISGIHESGIGAEALTRIGYGGPVLYTPHHLAHASAAFFPSPFDRAAVLTIDGVGEWATASYGVGEGSCVSLSREMRFPHSLGLLYSAFTYFCGFKVNSGEYKLMGLAPYGTPRYVEMIKKHVAQIGADGAVTLNQDYFDYLGGLEMVNDRFAGLFGGPRRLPESRVTRREMDLAASIQAFTEEAVLSMARHVRKETGERYLCLAGGVALNCVANGKLYREKLFDEIWIQPAAGDSGSALGAALAVQFGHHRIARPPKQALDRQKGSYLGPQFSEREVEAYLVAKGCAYRKLDIAERGDTVAEALAQGAVVGFFNGRMEFGPRSLGARSILGDPRREDTQRTMNLRIKYRESFRPFAPAVLAEDVETYFEYSGVSPYMLMVAPVREDRCKKRTEEFTGDDLLAAVNQVRSDLPAVTHWDYSARIQTVHAETNPLFHEVISRFKTKTGISVVVNTSFNVRGEPVVCTPDDAYRCFMRTDMDYLYLEGFWLDKREQPVVEKDESWMQEFELD